MMSQSKSGYKSEGETEGVYEIEDCVKYHNGDLSEILRSRPGVVTILASTTSGLRLLILNQYITLQVGADHNMVSS